MTWTVLHDACEHQDIQVILERANPVDAHCVDDHGSTPLHIACGGCPPIEVVRALMDQEVLLLQDKHGDTPLHIAVSSPETDVEVVQVLLETCPEAAKMINKEGLMPLHCACRYSSRNAEFISLLLEAHPEAAKHRIKLGDPAPKARNSAEYALVPNQEKLHALVEGTPRRDGSSKCSVDLRFEARGVQTRDGSYPLHMAIMELAPTEVLDMLINAAPEVLSLTNKHDETPLHVAIIHGLDDITMEFLINKSPGHAFEIRDRVDGNLPIHLALIHDYKIGTLLQILTRYPYAVRIRNNEGCLPMDLAKDADVVDLLLVSDEAYDKEPVEVEENFVDTDSSFDGDEKPHRYDIALE